MSSTKTLLIGIDAGGTKTRLAYKVSDEEQIIEGAGPGINFTKDGLEVATDRCLSIIDNHCGHLPNNLPLYLCAGIAGAGRTEDRNALTALLKTRSRNFISPQIQLFTDADIAYHAAHGHNSGILMIVGTGSIILARTTSGQMVRAGGWGRLLGDEAGGFRLAQAGLSAIADAMDGGPSTSMQHTLATLYGIADQESLIKFVYQEKTQIQLFAPVVLQAAENEDGVAVQIIERQQTLLLDQLAWLLGKHKDIDWKVVFTGGLRNNPYFIGRLKQLIMLRFPNMECSTTSVTPVLGALDLAIHQWSTAEGASSG